MNNDSSQSTLDDSALDPTDHRKLVRERYAGLASTDSACCPDTDGSTCCPPADADTTDPQTRSRQMGYSATELTAAPSGANLGLGCGNPTAIADLEPGETVLDLGSGAGFDCFLAATEVGPTGRVIGVDMTPEMIETARDNIDGTHAATVEFRLGEIEHLPVADASIDVIISNCVINLSPDKPQVFRDAYRVLRPGGRMSVSDVVATADLPPDIRTDQAAVAACVAGASSIPALEGMLRDAGFANVSIEPKDESEAFISEWDDERDLSDYLVSATIEARKPPK